MSTLAPLPPPTVPLFTAKGAMQREWYLWFKSIDDQARALNENPFLTPLLTGTLALADGVTAPTAITGEALVFVDSADGDLKVRFGDAVTKLIVADT